MSMMMYCEGQSMQMEQAFSLDDVTYVITSQEVLVSRVSS